VNNKSSVYLDYAASTPLEPRVLESMMPFFIENPGNPSSVHVWGQVAENAVEASREKIAKIMHSRTEEIVFTSGGTESDNLAIRGIALQRKKGSGANHILISPTEHPAVMQTARDLAENWGFQLELLPVDSNGMVDPNDVAAFIKKETALVSVIYANNEIGTINPIQEIGIQCRQKDIPFHSDGVQAAAHLSMDIQRDHLDLFSAGAHKFFGPKGTGFLVHKRDIPLISTQTGGKQEENLRAGTHNVPYIVGMARAFEIAQTEYSTWREKVVQMRDRIIAEVLSCTTKVKLTGHTKQRLPNHASFVFENVDGNTLVGILDANGYACSSGSACKSGTPKPSDVLVAIGLSKSWAMGSLRITLGREINADLVDGLIPVLKSAIEQARRR
jgi:cysteine desulfurase